MTCTFPIASICRRNTAILLVLHGAQIAWSRRDAGGACGGGIMMAPFALIATGSGASYWCGIVLAMAAQCLDTQRWIGTCAAPSLRSCLKHHGSLHHRSYSEWRGAFSSEQDKFFQNGTGSNRCHVRPKSPKPRFGTKQIFWSSDVSFGLVSCGVSFGLVSCGRVSCSIIVGECIR